MSNPSNSGMQKDERVLGSNLQSFLPYALNQQILSQHLHQQRQQQQELQRQNNMRLSQYNRDQQEYMSNCGDDVKFLFKF